MKASRVGRPQPPSEPPRAAVPPAQPLTPCNNSELRKATRQLGQLYDDIVGGSGMRASQLGLLFQIEAMRGPTMKALARIIVMDLSALGHTLKPLVRDGYVALVADERDRRVKRVFLTEAGKAKTAEGLDLWRLAQGRVEAVLGSAGALALRQTLAMLASDQFAEAFRTVEPRFDPDALSRVEAFRASVTGGTP